MWERFIAPIYGDLADGLFLFYLQYTIYRSGIYHVYIYIYIHTWYIPMLRWFHQPSSTISHHQIMWLFGTDPNPHIPAARSSSKPDFVERLQTFWRTACDFWRRRYRSTCEPCRSEWAMVCFTLAPGFRKWMFNKMSILKKY